MLIESRSSDPEDPLVGYSGITLFPRTLASIPNAPKPHDPNDVHHVHNFLRSMTFRSPSKCLEQAKAVVDSNGAGHRKPEITSCVTSEDKNELIAAAMGLENPQERRPALGRKRARFSLKSNSSQPTLNLETSLDIDKLKDPEEFFLAVEKLENARRELQKQTGGGVMDLNQQNPSMTARPRRPGILGRSVKYKHHYSNVASSKEATEDNILSPSERSLRQESSSPNYASQQRELADSALQEVELAGPMVESEKKVNDLLDELLGNNCEELGEEDAVPILQEHLQIKPIDLGKLCLPDLQDVRRIDLKASGAKLPKRRNVLSDIQNMLQGISSKTPKKHREAENSGPSQASPTPAKSPLSSIVSLKKHIMLSDQLSDPFSALDFDQPALRNASSSDSIKNQADHINMELDLSTPSKLKSPMMEESNTADRNTSLPQVATGDATHSADRYDNDNISTLGSGVDVDSTGCHVDVESKLGGSCVGNRVVNEILSRPDTDTDLQTNDLNESDDKVEDMLPEAVDFLQPGDNMETVENLNSTQVELDQANPPVVDHATDEPSKTAGTDPEQQTEEVQISIEGPSNGQNKETSRPLKKSRRKEVSHRQSLAVSGTSWESGVRRSTRIKSRPLEYWKGERFLYGRVHQSLTTVIGIKYASPGTADGKPVIKVKSFVSDEYKDLVDLAARF